MQTRIFQQSTDHIDALFTWPLIGAVAAAELAGIDQEALSVWCHKGALYQVPTTALIGFLTARLPNPQHQLGIG